MKKKIVFGFLAIFTLSISSVQVKGGGCVNGPNVCYYCFNSGGEYTCKDYWIYNCITAVNNEQ